MSSAETRAPGKALSISLLSAKDGDLFAQNILLISAEKPRGTPVFKELITDPPATEKEFEGFGNSTLIDSTTYERV
jgi:hypothetical protein